MAPTAKRFHATSSRSGRSIRTFPIVLLGCLVAALTACQGDGPSIGDRAHFERVIRDRYSETVRERLMPEAARLAKSQSFSENVQWQFIYSFFDGYEHGAQEIGGEIIIDGGEGIHQRGFAAGDNHWLRTRDFSLIDFDYEPVKVAGYYTRTNFEECAFRPDGMKETWSLDFREGLWDGHTDQTNRPPYYDSLRCRFRGFLDPRRGFLGHFNMYDRELIVVEILEIATD